MGYHLSKKHNKNVNIDEEMSDFNESNYQIKFYLVMIIFI